MNSLEVFKLQALIDLLNLHAGRGFQPCLGLTNAKN